VTVRCRAGGELRGAIRIAGSDGNDLLPGVPLDRRGEALGDPSRPDDPPAQRRRIL